MPLPLEVKQDLYRLLPPDYLAEAPFLNGRLKPPTGTFQEHVEWWAQRHDGVLDIAFEYSNIRLDVKLIGDMHRITGVELHEDDLKYLKDQQQNIIFDALLPHVDRKIISQFRKGNFRNIGGTTNKDQILDEDLTADELWVASEKIAQPIVLLKNRKSKSTTQEPVSCWNPKLASDWQAGIWIRVDMRHHPNEKLRSEGVLEVHVDHRNEGNSWAKLEKGASLSIGKREKALYGLEEVDYPCLEILETKTPKKTRDALSTCPQACDDYEQVYWEECFPA